MQVRFHMGETSADVDIVSVLDERLETLVPYHTSPRPVLERIAQSVPLITADPLPPGTIFRWDIGHIVYIVTQFEPDVRTILDERFEDGARAFQLAMPYVILVHGFVTQYGSVISAMTHHGCGRYCFFSKEPVTSLSDMMFLPPLANIMTGVGGMMEGASCHYSGSGYSTLLERVRAVKNTVYRATVDECSAFWNSTLSDSMAGHAADLEYNRRFGGIWTTQAWQRRTLADPNHIFDEELIPCQTLGDMLIGLRNVHSQNHIKGLRPITVRAMQTW